MAKKNEKSFAKDNACVLTEGLKKFKLYASCRGIYLKEKTYGFYEVRKGNKKSVLGAVQAVSKEGENGWVINWADRQRKFISESDKSVVVGKKVSANECLKAHTRKKAAKTPPSAEELN